MPAINLAEMPGLERAKNLVHKILTEAPHLHGVLICCPENQGANELVSALAKGWLCTNLKDGIPCGDCQSCKSFENGKCVDFQNIVPVGAGNIIKVSSIVGHLAKDEKEMTTVPVDTFFRTMPLMSRHKVVAIGPADRMHPRATNALLKTLEEPYDFAKIILHTPSVVGILPTIISRCLVIHADPPNHQQIAQSLGELSEAEAIFGEFAIKRILNIRENLEIYNEILDFCRKLATSAPSSALKQSETAKLLGEKLAKILDIASRQANAELLNCLGQYMRQEITPLTSGIPKVLQTHRRILQNAQVSMQFDDLFASILHLNR